MALFGNTEQFAYVRTDGNIVQISGGNLTDAGDWAAGTPYVANDVVSHDGALYVALVASTGQPPSGNRDDRWSSLVKVRRAGGSHGSPYYLDLTDQVTIVPVRLSVKDGVISVEY